MIADSGDGLSVSIVMSNCSVEPPTDSEETTLNDVQSGEPPKDWYSSAAADKALATLLLVDEKDRSLVGYSSCISSLYVPPVTPPIMMRYRRQ